MDIVQARRALNDKMSGVCSLATGNHGSLGPVKDGTEQETLR